MCVWVSVDSTPTRMRSSCWLYHILWIFVTSPICLRCQSKITHAKHTHTTTSFNGKIYNLRAHSFRCNALAKKYATRRIVTTKRTEQISSGISTENQPRRLQFNPFYHFTVGVDKNLHKIQMVVFFVVLAKWFAHVGKWFRLHWKHSHRFFHSIVRMVAPSFHCRAEYNFQCTD